MGGPTSAPAKNGGRRIPAMCSIQIPARDAITDNTPLRLETAAALAFPDGSMTAVTLRRMIANGQLKAVKLAGRYYTTLAAIGEITTPCLVKPKARASSSTQEASGISGMDNSSVALDAMNLTAKALKENLPNTSSKSTTQSKGSTVIIPISRK